MNLFTRVREELLALGFETVDDHSYSEDGSDNFEAVKDGDVYSFSCFWQEFDPAGPNKLHWGMRNKEGYFEGYVEFDITKPVGNGFIVVTGNSE